MTAKMLRHEVDVNLHDIEFEHNGVSGAICPFSRDDIAVKYGDSEHTFDSVDAFMNEPFIEGKPLKDIIEDFTIYLGKMFDFCLFRFTKLYIFINL